MTVLANNKKNFMKFFIFGVFEDLLEIALKYIEKRNLCKANSPFQIEDMPMQWKKYVGFCSTSGRGHSHF